MAAARLTDIAGRDLAAEALRLHPRLKILLSDRYGAHGGTDDYPVLRKPYRFGAFIHALREQLLSS